MAGVAQIPFSQSGHKRLIRWALSLGQRQEALARSALIHQGKSTPLNSRSPSVLRHGSEAGLPTPVSEETSSPENRDRERSRDRQPSASAQARAKERAGKEQLPRSTLAAIDRLEVVVAALDQTSRSQAHVTSTTTTKYAEIQKSCE